MRSEFDQTDEKTGYPADHGESSAYVQTRITTALLLAAGTGSRLSPLTDEMPKCLTMVDETVILGRLIDCLHQHEFKRLVVVVGHYEQQIRDYLDKFSGDIAVEYVVSSPYRTTNNIYSLWLVRDKIQEPFILIESDLIFEPSLLEEMLVPDRIAVSHTLPWMNGTTVTTDDSVPAHVTTFNIGSGSTMNGSTYKTVNIYSFSRGSWKQIVQRLDRWISTGKVNAYYEAVLAEMVADGSLNLQCIFFDRQRWYEIDTIKDIREAEKIFQQIERSGTVAV